MVRHNSEAGFSLLELMVAALLTVGLMGGVFTIMNRNQNVFVTESAVTDMNENVRTAIDLLTRDVQTSGVGLTRSTSNNARGDFAAVFYTNGEDDQPDSLLMVNGDPFVPTADVSSHVAGSSDFIVNQPSDLATSTGDGSSSLQFLYSDRAGNQQRIFQATAADPLRRRYIVYDDTRLRVFSLTTDAEIVPGSTPPRIKLEHDPAQALNPANKIGSAMDTEEPSYETAKIAVLDSLVGYRLDTDTGELMRTENMDNWYSVARGIIGFQVQYRVIAAKGAPDAIVEAPLERRTVRSLIITITAETPDIPQTDRRYRQTTRRIEVTPRNLNLINNNNLTAS